MRPSWRRGGRRGWRRPIAFERGYGWISAGHVTQADKGCDFDFLDAAFGAKAGEPDIF